LGAVRVEQLRQSAREHTQMCAALGGQQEQRLCTRRGVLQAVLSTVRARGAFVRNQRLDVARLLDLRPTIEAARMSGNHLSALQDAHRIESGQYNERTADVIVRSRVIP